MSNYYDLLQLVYRTNKRNREQPIGLSTPKMNKCNDFKVLSAIIDTFEAQLRR